MKRPPFRTDVPFSAVGPDALIGPPFCADIPKLSLRTSDRVTGVAIRSLVFNPFRHPPRRGPMRPAVPRRRPRSAGQCPANTERIAMTKKRRPMVGATRVRRPALVLIPSSLHPFIPSPLHPFIPSPLHSLIPSFLHPFIPSPFLSRINDESFHFCSIQKHFFLL